ncbi:MAG: translocation/assembly module TamB domain-containing protein, partial [Myxococcaceae bacterium]|nr:translocation/assembly module TamB domain-containing protein [Myxococcaceae bacterium]
EALTGAAPPPLAGAGTLSVALSGPPKRPRLTARGALFRLRVASAAAERLDLDVTLPDVSAPFDAAGRLTARGLDVSGRRLDEVRADVKTHGRELALTLETKGLGDLRLSLDGTLDADASGLALTGLRLDDARAAWALAGPARLRWSPSLELSPLTLASKGQRFEARATLRGQRLDAAVTATDVNLATLPRVLAPEALGLSGVVSGRVSATGRLPRPDVTASLRARDAAVLGVRHVDGRLDGALEGGVARGTASVSTSLGAVDGAFEVPLAGLLDDAPEPLSVRASFTGVSLEALQAWRAQTWPVSGTLSGRLELGGRANDPALTLLVESPRVTVTPTGPLTGPLHLDATALGVSSRDAGALAVTLGARVEGAEARLTLDTPLSLRALRAKSPTVERLRALPVTLSLALTDLPLSALRRLGVPGADDVAGVASLRVAATGSVDDPRGQATLSWRGVTAPPLEGLDGALELTTTDTVTRLAGTGRLEGRPLFELDAFVDAPPGRLVAPAALGAEQVTARLSLAPMPLGRFFPHRDDDVVPSGSVSVDLGVTGRLDDPQVSVDATVQALSFGKVPLGQARLVSRTKGRSQALALTLKARGNSELRATGVVGFDPSIELLRQGLDIGAVPLRLDVTATAFDLGFLSGVTPTVRTVGGRLGLDAFEVRGTLGAPDLNGTVTWKQGRLALASSGDFRDIDVEVGVTNERIDVRTLSVRSGSGSLVLDPSSAQRRPGAGWQLRGSGAASRFSLVNDDQLLAIVSAKVKLEGEVTPGLVDLSTVELARVDVELPEVKRKDVQDLERPRDVVLVRGGRVVAGRRRADGPVAAAAPSRAWRAVLVAPRNLWVRSSDLNVELGLSDAFRVEYADSTQLFGEARVLGGRIDVIGREFKVNRVDPSGQRSESTARFTGPASTPLINV